VVDFVPPCYGIRCGAKVAGYLTPESDGQVTEIKAPKKSENRAHSLTDVLKTYGINKATDTLVFETPCAYCTHTMKVDSKLYGLPQTRQRVYMFVWRPEKDNVNDDLGDYWEAIFQFLQSPARNSMEAFILEDDHEIIRTFREGIAGKCLTVLLRQPMHDVSLSLVYCLSLSLRIQVPSEGLRRGASSSRSISGTQRVPTSRTIGTLALLAVSTKPPGRSLNGMREAESRSRLTTGRHTLTCSRSERWMPLRCSMLPLHEMQNVMTLALARSVGTCRRM
jgi:hypothetical protein